MLSPNATEQHIKDLYAMVINLPALGELPEDHEKVWIGPRLRPLAPTGDTPADTDLVAALQSALEASGLLGLLPGR